MLRRAARDQSWSEQWGGGLGAQGTMGVFWGPGDTESKGGAGDTGTAGCGDSRVREPRGDLAMATVTPGCPQPLIFLPPRAGSGTRGSASGLYLPGHGCRRGVAREHGSDGAQGWHGDGEWARGRVEVAEVQQQSGWGGGWQGTGVGTGTKWAWGQQGMGHGGGLALEMAPGGAGGRPVPTVSPPHFQLVKNCLKRGVSRPCGRISTCGTGTRWARRTRGRHRAPPPTLLCPPACGASSPCG